MDAPTTQPKTLEHVEQEKTDKISESDPLQEAWVRLAEMNELFTTERIHEDIQDVGRAERSMYSGLCKELLVFRTVSMIWFYRIATEQPSRH
ncbi:hypothetical protein FBULB1_13181 [Fusarium bulbicola]|nr:hypothetical protein FBULB1_13181 [Fusarium bulbicola]